MPWVTCLITAGWQCVSRWRVQSAMRDALDASLSTLDARERIVVRMRYGLDDGCPRTLEDIGKYFKVRLLVQVA